MKYNILVKALAEHFDDNNFSLSGDIGNYIIHKQGEKINVNTIDIESLYIKYEVIQAEIDRCISIEKAIPYSVKQEIALINKGIKNPNDEEYLAYRIEVDAIKANYPST